MAVTFNQFFYAIAIQESNGRYNAVNRGSGALGKYQIMPFNIGPWSKRYLNRRWTPAQFLADPKKQDALAFAVLADYYSKYGARGAAAAWYSGNPRLANNYRPQRGGPSIGAYVDQVLAKASRVSSSRAARAYGVNQAPGDPEPTLSVDVQDQSTTSAALANKTNKELTDPTYLKELADPFPGSSVSSTPGAEPMTFPGDKTASAGVEQMLDNVGGVGDKGPEGLPLGPVSNEGAKPLGLGPADQPTAAIVSTAAARSSGAATLGSGSGRGGWQWQMATLRKKFPGLKMTSGYRPGSITSSGNVSFHAKGRAVDLPASMAVFNWIRANYGATSKEIIFSPAGRKQIKNGKGFVYSGKVVSDHNDHIHWAF